MSSSTTPAISPTFSPNAYGVKNGLSALRTSRWIGGSVSTGMSRRMSSGSWTEETPSALL